ncbi:MAG: RES family NAD+ phosphorylase [Calothrix sp. SM1_5_4]|nr:RES family NAD+ phosphorylase [Calothrix sp. SM1_5_4]
MILFRTCTAKKPSPALKFVSNSAAIPGIIKLLASKEMVEEVFGRRLPIPSEFQSRFGPPGFMKNILYASEKKRTTLYEFGYHLLLNPINHGKAINASTFELKLVTINPLIDVSQESNLSLIMHKTDYSAAHGFILKQNLQQLDTLKYPNVRDSIPGGLNYAVYKSESVETSSNLDAEDLILIPRADETIEVQRTQSLTETIKPVMR